MNEAENREQGVVNREQKELEQALTRALRPVEVRAELTHKLLALAAEVEAERLLPRRERKHRWAWFVPRPRRWLLPSLGTAVAAALAMGVFAGESVHQRHQREALATQQFEQTSRIQDQALEEARQQLERAGVPLQ